MGIVLLFVVIVILRNRGLDDEDWYDEDDDDDDYYEEDRLSFLDIARNRQTSAQPVHRLGNKISGPTGSPTPRGGPHKHLLLEEILHHQDRQNSIVIEQYHLVQRLVARKFQRR